MSILKKLAADPEFQAIVRAAEKMRPDLPEWSPEIPDSEKEWIYRSGMRAGFELCFQIFADKRSK